MDFMVYWKI